MTKIFLNFAQVVERLSLLVALFLVVLIAVLSYRAWSEFGKDSAQARAQLALINQVNDLLLSVTEAETGQRGFLLTGEDFYLEPYNRALLHVPADLDAIRAAAISETDQRQRVDRLVPLIKEKMDELAAVIDAKRTAGTDAALALVRTGHGQIAMNRIRDLSAEIQGVAIALRSEHADRGRANANQIGLVSIIGSAMLFALLGFATLTIRQATERRQHLIGALRESELRATEARDWLQTTLGSIGDGVIATDSAGRVVFLNGVASQLTGWTQEQASGIDIEKVFVLANENGGLPVENPVRQALREGRIVDLANHIQLKRTDGTSISIDDTAAPIRDKEGTAVGAVLVFRDVTEDRERQRQEERSSRALASANKDLQQFAYAASHDLREPLRTIKVFAEILQTTASTLQEKHRAELQFIIDGADRMESLVNSLLEYSTAGAVREKPLGEVNMETALATALENLRAAIDESQAMVSHDSLPTIQGDPNHMALVFQNLVGNAIKYRRAQAPRIFVSGKRSGHEWIFSVKDDGIGIAPQHQESVFDIFRRLHDQTLPGSGIGLATCRRIVERYQGRMWLESELHKGSTFFFALVTK